MTLPDFLIIGAMKAGTTTMYRDLITNPDIYMPIDKEPECLVHDNVLTPDGSKVYANHFQPAKPNQTCGEASTAYTKLPDYKNVPQRAVKILKQNFKVIYIVREPVARIISHHYHASNQAQMDRDINTAIHNNNELINYSRYALQIEPWLEAIGPDRIRIVKFETYVEERIKTIVNLCRFLDVKPRQDLIQPGKIYNQGTARSDQNGLLGWLPDNSLYRKFIRPLLPIKVKDAIRNTLLPKVDAPPLPPTPETVDYILDQLAPDMDKLIKHMGLDSNNPPWNPAVVRQTYRV